MPLPQALVAGENWFQASTMVSLTHQTTAATIASLTLVTSHFFRLDRWFDTGGLRDRGPGAVWRKDDSTAGG